MIRLNHLAPVIAAMLVLLAPLALIASPATGRPVAVILSPQTGMRDALAIVAAAGGRVMTASPSGSVVIAVLGQPDFAWRLIRAGAWLPIDAAMFEICSTPLRQLDVL